MNLWRVILATMVIFVCGIVTGAMLTKTLEPKTEPVTAAAIVAPTNLAEATPKKNVPMPAAPMFQLQRANFLKVLDKQLELTASQRDQIGKIMKASQERTQPLWNQIAPQMNDELKKVREDIRQVLTPDQRKKFFDLLRRGRKPDGTQSNSRAGRPSESTTSATNEL